eukprot:10311958-Alexandrium_andersonii.AAC.1
MFDKGGARHYIVEPRSFARGVLGGQLGSLATHASATSRLSQRLILSVATLSGHECWRAGA